MVRRAIGCLTADDVILAAVFWAGTGPPCSSSPAGCGAGVCVQGGAGGEGGVVGCRAVEGVGPSVRLTGGALCF